MTTRQLAPKQRIINGQVMTIQQRYSKCGKVGCWCRARGKQGHGPYWYGRFYGTDGKLKSRYIGKELPEVTP